jgi:hypothetical protein
MSIELNHTIVWATDREASAGFLARILGIPVGPAAGPFRQIQIANGVTLAFANAGEVQVQHGSGSAPATTTGGAVRLYQAHGQR